MENKSEIKCLRGADRIRKRPAVFFGSNGIEGAEKAIKGLLDIFVTEAILGYSDGIYVSIHKDNSITIYSMDRGFLFDETLQEGKPMWHHAFCDLYFESDTFGQNPFFYYGSKHELLYGELKQPIPKYQADSDCWFDLCWVQSVSKYMQIESIRDGIKTRLEFENGQCISDPQKESTQDQTKTSIHFLIDSEVFDDVNISVESISDLLENISITIPGLYCEINDDRSGVKEAYYYTHGIEEYIQKKCSPTTSIFINEKEANGNDKSDLQKYDARVKAYIAFSDKEPKTICYHNYRVLKYGGVHLNNVREKIRCLLNQVFYDDLDGVRTIDNFMDTLTVILESNCSAHFSRYQNALKNAITNKLISEMAIDLIDESFEKYLRISRQSILSALKR